MTTPTDTETRQALDLRWMVRAISQARRARGRVAPNPAVGAVIVKNGEVVGEGSTEPPGNRHAEIVALDQAGDSAKGAELYVTLEPCAHYGRTPPCLDAVLRVGITRVCIALLDPNPLVNGKSVAAFQENGVEVVVGVGAEETTRLNAGYFKRLETGLPEVHVKFAISLDGKIATRAGNSRWISGPEARMEGHRIRDASDAILVGVGTVLLDNPRLDTRLELDIAGNGGPHHPLRVVLDSYARTPVDAAMLSPEVPGSTLIFVTESAPVDRIERLRSAGAEMATVSARNGRVDVRAMLEALGQRGINTLMVEGGGKVIGSLADERLIDRLTVFIAPVLLGGEGSPSPVGGIGVETVDEGLRMRIEETRMVGDNLCVSGYVIGSPAGAGSVKCLPES